MRIVNRDQERPRRCERPDRLEHGCRHGALVGRPIVIATDKERQFERSPLRWREGRQDEIEILLKQVRERRVGQPDLAAGGPALDDPEPGRRGGGDGRLPDRGLADARLSLDEQSTR